MSIWSKPCNRPGEVRTRPREEVPSSQPDDLSRWEKGFEIVGCGVVVVDPGVSGGGDAEVLGGRGAEAEVCGWAGESGAFEGGEGEEVGFGGYGGDAEV